MAKKPLGSRKRKKIYESIEKETIVFDKEFLESLNLHSFSDFVLYIENSLRQVKTSWTFNRQTTAFEHIKIIAVAAVLCLEKFGLPEKYETAKRRHLPTAEEAEKAMKEFIKKPS